MNLLVVGEKSSKVMGGELQFPSLFYFNQRYQNLKCITFPISSTENPPTKRADADPET